MKKGFTLIELLAVIVILAIIALIAVPIVLNIINDSKESSLLRSAEFYLDAAEYAVADAFLYHGGLSDGKYPITPNGDICKVDETPCKEENLLKVEVNGDKPTGGYIEIKNGNIFGISLILDEKTIVKNSVGELVYSKCEAVTSSNVTTGNVPTGDFNNGDEYVCQIAPGVEYHFFVVSVNEDGTVNLIMDRNITTSGIAVSDSDKGLVAWITESDYNVAVSNMNQYTSNFRIQFGAITLMNALEKSVNDWTLESVTKEMTVNGYHWDGETGLLKVDNTAGATSYTLNNLKARLLTVDEAISNGCRAKVSSSITNVNTCPLYLSNYLSHKNGYVTGSGVVNVSSGIRGYWLANGAAPDNGFLVHDDGNINSRIVTDGSYAGIRPVITLSTSQLN